MRPVGVVARGWGWRHGGRREWAVRDLDLAIEPGERVLLLGPSGGGKSTLLAALAGVRTGDESGEQRGTLEVDGRTPAPGLAGLVLQDPETQVILPRTADDVAFGAENLGVPPAEIAERTARSLELVGLALPPDHPTSALSGGQKQRLALAGVLTMRPGLLLLDEPTANLDPQGAAAVRDAVAAAAAYTGATLVVVEHRVDRWLPVVDRVVVLGPAGLLADGDPARVLADQGAALAAAGVWVPGREPEPPALPAAGAPVLLGTRGLGVGRGGTVLRLADRDVGAAGALLVAGPNGAGKTAALLTLGGLIPPVEGAVAAAPALAAGLPSDPFRWRARDLPARIASVLQSPQHQFVASTVRREVALGLPATAAGRARADAVLERIGLAGLAEANPFTLSVGQQRRLTVGAALVARPRLLLLDEPTFGQDARTWAALARLLVEAIADGVAIVAATHDERLLAGASDVLTIGEPRVAA